MPLLNTGHIWLIGILLVVVLIVWGPSKLPEVGSGLGRAMNEFRKASSEARNEFNRMTHPDAVAEATPAHPTAAAVPPPPPAPPEPPPAPPQPAVTVAAEPAAVGAVRAGDSANGEEASAPA